MLNCWTLDGWACHVTSTSTPAASERNIPHLNILAPTPRFGLDGSLEKNTWVPKFSRLFRTKVARKGRGLKLSGWFGRFNDC